MSRVKKTGKGRPHTPDVVRERIRTGVVLNRLQKHALGKLEMTTTQVRAAEILLRKTVPDLSSTELRGEVTHHHDITDEPMTEDEWETQYSDGVAPASGSAEVTH